MQRKEPAGHTFLLRIWIEETRDERGRVTWRGHITHLPDEQRRPVETFGQINHFIYQHLSEQADADPALPGRGWRLQPVLSEREVEADESSAEGE